MRHRLPGFSFDRPDQQSIRTADAPQQCALQRDMNMVRSSRSSQGSVASLARLDADRATTDDNSDETAAEIARRPCELAREDLRRCGDHTWPRARRSAAGGPELV